MTTFVGGLHDVAAWWAQWMAAMAWQVVLVVAVVWVITRWRAMIPASVRYLLWMLALVKLVIPPWIAAPWSVGSIAVAMGVLSPDSAGRYIPFATAASEGGGAVQTVPPASPAHVAFDRGDAIALLFIGWLLVAIVMFTVIVIQYLRFACHVRRDLETPSSAVQAVFSQQLKALRMPDLVLLRLCPAIERPGIFGIIHPVILLPKDAEEDFDAEVIGNVLAHELAHIKRFDLLVGWFVMVMTCLYWFHPAVWLAVIYSRREREMACDDLVIESTQQDGNHYASSILQVAERFSGSVPMGAGFLGMLELSDNLLQRLRAAADSGRRRNLPGPAIVMVALLVLAVFPMGAAVSAAPEPTGDTQGPPMIVSTSPAVGQKDVDPATRELTVTFDKDMGKGFSWTGGGEVFPKTTARPFWRTPQTCVLPVQLEAGRFYRVGFNSTSHRNFRATNGQALPPSVLYFTTKGADAATLAKLEPPHVVRLEPENGAQDVPSSTSQLTVTFDKAMGGGFSWTGRPDERPEFSGRPLWINGKRACIVKVKLEPNRTYTISLNSLYAINFMSESGVPLKPVVWTFRTGK